MTKLDAINVLKCLQCGHDMRTTVENYRYEPVDGLVVTLAGIEVSRCPNCGEHEATIPRIEELHRKLAGVVVRKRARLVPAEIRFLRTYLGLSGTDFAKMMGVDKTTVSKWENDAQPIGPQADRLLRLMVAHSKPIDEYPIETLSDVAEEEPRKGRLGAVFKKNHWEAEAA